MYVVDLNDNTYMYDIYVVDSNDNIYMYDIYVVHILSRIYILSRVHVHIYIVAYIYIVYAQHMYDIPMPAQDAKNHTMAVHERSNCPLEPSCESKYKSE